MVLPPLLRRNKVFFNASDKIKLFTFFFFSFQINVILLFCKKKKKKKDWITLNVEVPNNNIWWDFILFFFYWVSFLNWVDFMVVVLNCAKIGHIKCKHPDVFICSFLLFVFFLKTCRYPYTKKFEIKKKKKRKYKTRKVFTNNCLKKKWNDILSQTKPFPGEVFFFLMLKLYISISNGFQKHLRKQNVYKKKCIFILMQFFLFFLYEK